MASRMGNNMMGTENLESTACSAQRAVAFPLSFYLIQAGKVSQNTDLLLSTSLGFNMLS